MSVLLSDNTLDSSMDIAPEKPVFPGKGVGDLPIHPPFLIDGKSRQLSFDTLHASEKPFIILRHILQEHYAEGMVEKVRNETVTVANFDIERAIRDFPYLAYYLAGFFVGRLLSEDSLYDGVFGCKPDDAILSTLSLKEREGLANSIHERFLYLEIREHKLIEDKEHINNRLLLTLSWIMEITPFPVVSENSLQRIIKKYHPENRHYENCTRDFTIDEIKTGVPLWKLRKRSVSPPLSLRARFFLDGIREELLVRIRTIMNH